MSTRYVRTEISRLSEIYGLLDNRTTQLRANAEGIELPSGALLDAHWRIAEILSTSGMAENIDKHLKEWDDIKMHTYGP